MIWFFYVQCARQSYSNNFHISLKVTQNLRIDLSSRYPMTVCTNSFEQKLLLAKFMAQTCDNQVKVIFYVSDIDHFQFISIVDTGELLI